jgi:prepilin-type N-terminal cleavage/methylation domain-containing protein
MSLRGFTMIELLIVLVIIGVLATLGGSSYVKSLSRGRDARRIEDMKTVQKGFELYYSRHGKYGITADSCDSMFTDASVFPTTTVIQDDSKLGSYAYTCSTLNQSYCVCALVENKGYGNSETSDCSTFSNDKTVTSYYCVQSIQ